MSGDSLSGPDDARSPAGRAIHTSWPGIPLNATFLYEDGGRRVELRIGAPTEVRTSFREPRQALPLQFSYGDTKITYPMDVETGRLILADSGCMPGGETSEGECRDFHSVRFPGAGSLPPLLVGTVAPDPASFPKETLLVTRGTPRTVTFEASETSFQGEACTRVTTSPPHVPKETFIASMMQVQGSYLFCGELPLPVEFSSISERSSFELSAYDDGDGWLNVDWNRFGVELPEFRLTPSHLESEPLGRIPPEAGGNLGRLPVSEAFQHARDNDPAFAAYLEGHPDAKLLESKIEDRSEFGPTTDLAGLQTTERIVRSLRFFDPTSTEGYEVHVEKTNNTLGLTDKQVTRSLPIMTDRINVSDLPQSHVPVAQSLHRTCPEFTTAYLYYTVDPVLEAVGNGSHLLSYRYIFIHRGYVIPGGGIEYFYTCQVDSDDGSMWGVDASEETIRQFR